MLSDNGGGEILASTILGGIEAPDACATCTVALMSVLYRVLNLCLGYIKLVFCFSR